MKLTLGKVSHLLNTAKGSVLNYESRGLVNTQRDPENGYRYFNAIAVDDLRKIRAFRSLGFSLKETGDIFEIERPEDLEEMLRAKKKELVSQITEIQTQINGVVKLEEKLAKIAGRAGGCSIAKSPELLWLPITNDEDKGRSWVGVENEWAQNMPDVCVSTRLGIAGKTVNGSVGFSVLAGCPAAKMLPAREDVELIKPMNAIYRIVDYSYNEEEGYCLETFRPLMEYASAKGFRPTGEILMRGILTLRQNGTSRYYAEAWLILGG